MSYKIIPQHAGIWLYQKKKITQILVLINKQQPPPLIYSIVINSLYQKNWFLGWPSKIRSYKVLWNHWCEPNFKAPFIYSTKKRYILALRAMHLLAFLHWLALRAKTYLTPIGDRKENACLQLHCQVSRQPKRCRSAMLVDPKGRHFGMFQVLYKKSIRLLLSS